jgi:hypothetical protein
VSDEGAQRDRLIFAGATDAVDLDRWQVLRIIHFDFANGESIIDGFVHFGFHDRLGRHFLLAHRSHYLGLLGEDGKLRWTVAPRKMFKGIPNIEADIQFPMYVDSFQDGTIVVSNFGNNMLYRVDPKQSKAETFYDGAGEGMKHAGNCVVDNEGCVWVNEVEGSRIWKLDPTGSPKLVLGGQGPGFQKESVPFREARFNWIYDIRLGPEGNVYVLDSKNFAVRQIDLSKGLVRTIAGTGTPGYSGDGGNPRHATFGSDPSARFDGPISLSLDESGNIYVGDRFNHVVRMIERATNIIRTIAGDHTYAGQSANDENERNSLALRLPQISSMDYHAGHLFVPTDLNDDSGDLIVMVRSSGH